MGFWFFCGLLSVSPISRTNLIQKGVLFLVYKTEKRLLSSIIPNEVYNTVERKKGGRHSQTALALLSLLFTAVVIQSLLFHHTTMLISSLFRVSICCIANFEVIYFSEPHAVAAFTCSPDYLPHSIDKKLLLWAILRII